MSLHSLFSSSLFYLLFPSWQGIHLDPSIYLVDDENKSPAAVSADNNEAKPASVELDANAMSQTNNHASISSGVDENNENSGLLSSNIDAISNSVESMNLAVSVSGEKGLSLLHCIFMTYTSSLKWQCLCKNLVVFTGMGELGCKIPMFGTRFQKLFLDILYFLGCKI